MKTSKEIWFLLVLSLSKNFNSSAIEQDLFIKKLKNWSHLTNVKGCIKPLNFLASVK